VGQEARFASFASLFVARDVGWNFQVWKFHKFREFFKNISRPLLKFSLKFCILIIIHR